MNETVSHTSRIPLISAVQSHSVATVPTAVINGHSPNRLSAKSITTLGKFWTENENIWDILTAPNTFSLSFDTIKIIS